MQLSNKQTSRVAAALFFFVCVPLSLWDQFYVPQKIFVPQDPAATAINLLSNEFIFRTAIVTHLVGVVVFVFAMVLFTRLFMSDDKHLSWLMAATILALVPVVFVFEVSNFMALLILKSDAQSTLEVTRQQELAYILLRMNRVATGAGMGKFFIGLYFFVFGLLALRSRFTPRFIGTLLIIGGVGYLADCCIVILLQRADYLTVRSILKYTTAAYMLALLWFLIKGVRQPETTV